MTVTVINNYIHGYLLLPQGMSEIVKYTCGYYLSYKIITLSLNVDYYCIMHKIQVTKCCVYGGMAQGTFHIIHHQHAFK